MEILNFNLNPLTNTLDILVRVPNEEYYSAISIKRIAIQDYKHYTVSYPERPQIELIYNSPIEDFQIDIYAKEVAKIILPADLGTIGLDTTGPIYMYIETQGLPDETISCRCFSELTVAATINWHGFYKWTVKLWRRLFKDRCSNVRDKLIDLDWKHTLIEDAFAYQEYTVVNEIWDDLIRNDFEFAKCLDSCRIKLISEGANHSNCKSCK